MTLSQFATQILQLAISIILARLLVPADFGLLATVTVLTGFASLLEGFGLSHALIQRETISEQHLSSVFWINVLNGAILALVFLLGAPADRGFLPRAPTG